MGRLAPGFRLAPWTATLFLVAPRAGALVNRVGERVLLVAGLTLQALGFGWLALIAKPGVTYISMVVPMVVAGFGASMAMPAAQNCVLGSVPRWAMGKASGALNTLRQLGGTFGIAIAAAVFSEQAAATPRAAPSATASRPPFGPAPACRYWVPPLVAGRHRGHCHATAWRRWTTGPGPAHPQWGPWRWARRQCHPRHRRLYRLVPDEHGPGRTERRVRAGGRAAAAGAAGPLLPHARLSHRGRRPRTRDAVPGVEGLWEVRPGQGRPAHVAVQNSYQRLPQLARLSLGGLPSDLSRPSQEPTLGPAHTEVAWLQPLPNAWLSLPADPASLAVKRDSVRLAFVAALQHLPAKQRAVLLFREVLAWRATEVAELLDTSTAAVNSALQRARAQLDELAPNEDELLDPADPKLRQLLDGYIKAFEAADVDGLVSLLREDVLTEMPPSLTWFWGREATARFTFSVFSRLGAGGRQMVETSANGQPALAMYRLADDGLFHGPMYRSWGFRPAAFPV